jgi:hypothetical protein
VIIGLIIGTAGYALALAIVIASLSLLFNSRSHFLRAKTLVLTMAISVAAMISFFSPGAQIRSESLAAATEDPTINSVSRWFIVSTLELAASIFNIGVLFILLIGVLTSQYFDKLSPLTILKFDSRKFIKLSGVFLLIYYGTISISEYLTYNAFWHLITFKSCLFFYFYYLGVCLANRQKTPVSNLAPKILAAVTSTVLFLGVLVVSPTNYKLVERKIAWDRGSASLPGISDISPKGSWVDLCWNRISHQDKFPKRD